MGNSDSKSDETGKSSEGKKKRFFLRRKVNQQQKATQRIPSEIAEDTDSDSFSEDGDDRQTPPISHAKIQQTTWYQKAKGAYDQLVHAIIRPPRNKYEPAELGPERFNFCGKVFRRKDFTLRNNRGQKLFVSHWEPFDIDRKIKQVPCVIYMHGNSSCRKEAINQLSLVLSLGATLCTLDFSGSGMSDGEYVSLGIHEKDDLAAVIRHLRESGTVSKIALWGRSMGAATALLHGPRDSQLAAMICDSPFSSLVALAEGMVETGRKHGIYAPGFLVSLAIRFIRSSVLELAKFDVYDLSPADEAHASIIPLLLIAAEGDAFIPPTHSQLIYHNYGGPKHALVVPGDHNSVRPKRVLDAVAIFLANSMQIPDESISSEGLHFMGQPPWLQQEHLEMERSMAFSPTSVKQAQSHTQDIGVGMNRAQQNDAKDKLYNLLSGGSR